MAEISHRSIRVWAALRTLHEAHGAPLALLADAGRLTPRGVEMRARRDGWAAREGAAGAGALPLSERIGALAGRLVGEIEAIEREAVAGGYDKARIDAVTALTRALEKAGEIGEATQERHREQKKTDAELAEFYRRIDARIDELARGYAAELVGQGDPHPAG